MYFVLKHSVIVSAAPSLYCTIHRNYSPSSAFLCFQTERNSLNCTTSASHRITWTESQKHCIETKSASHFALPFQHDLRDEAHRRSLAREKKVHDRGQGASALLHAEETLRDASRREEQTVGPWGFEKIDEGEEKGELAIGSSRKKKRVFNTGKPVVGDDIEVGREDGGSGGGVEEVGGGEGGGNSGRVLRQGMAGVRDGLGVFEISVKDGDFHGFNGGGNIDGVDNPEAHLFQPLQHAAHEERCVGGGRITAEHTILIQLCRILSLQLMDTEEA